MPEAPKVGIPCMLERESGRELAGISIEALEATRSEGPGPARLGAALGDHE